MARARAPEEPRAGGLSLVIHLAAIAGFLDAVGVARLTGTFVAFQTGNIVTFGLGLSRSHPGQAFASAAAVIAFVAGSVLAPTVAGFGPVRPEVPQRRLLVAAGVLLVVAAGLTLAVAGFGSDSLPAWARYCVIVLAAVAMAFQTPVVRIVQGVAVSSTFSSGMLSDFGQALGRLRDPVGRARARVVSRVIGGIVFAFLVGAVLGGVVLEHWGNVAIAFPAIGVLLDLVQVRPC